MPVILEIGRLRKAAPSGIYVYCFLVKVRIQLQHSKFIIGHGTERREGAVGQCQKLGFFRRNFAAHLAQAVNQPGAAAGIVNTLGSLS